MPDVRRIDPLDADALRSAAEHDEGELAALEHLTETGVYFLPIELETRDNGRATCRACGNPIPKGGQAVSFQYDPWMGHGSLSKAFIHATFCPPDAAQEKGDNT